MTWSDTTLVFFNGNRNDGGNQIVSPAMFWNEDEGYYEVWGIALYTGLPAPRPFFRWTTTDLYDPDKWSVQDTLQLPIVPGTGNNSWHMDMRRDSTDGGHVYRAVISMSDFSLSDPYNGDIQYCEANASDDLFDAGSWTCDILMEYDPSVAWIEGGLYRPTIVPLGTPGQVPIGYRMWHGGISAANEWRIGETSFGLE